MPGGVSAPSLVGTAWPSSSGKLLVLPVGGMEAEWSKPIATSLCTANQIQISVSKDGEENFHLQLRSRDKQQQETFAPSDCTTAVRIQRRLVSAPAKAAVLSACPVSAAQSGCCSLGEVGTRKPASTLFVCLPPSPQAPRAMEKISLRGEF